MADETNALVPQDGASAIPESFKLEAEKADAAIMQLRHSMNYSALEAGVRCREFQEKGYYRALGFPDTEKGFDAWLASRWGRQQSAARWAMKVTGQLDFNMDKLARFSPDALNQYFSLPDSERLLLSSGITDDTTEDELIEKIGKHRESKPELHIERVVVFKVTSLPETVQKYCAETLEASRKLNQIAGYGISNEWAIMRIFRDFRETGCAENAAITNWDMYETYVKAEQKEENAAAEKQAAKEAAKKAKEQEKAARKAAKEAAKKAAADAEQKAEKKRRAKKEQVPVEHDAPAFVAKGKRVDKRTEFDPAVIEKCPAPDCNQVAEHEGDHGLVENGVEQMLKGKIVASSVVTVETTPQETTPAPKKRGRPKGSKNKPKVIDGEVPKVEPVETIEAQA